MPIGSRAYSVLFLGTDGGVSLAALSALYNSLQGRGPHAGLVTALTAVCGGARRPTRGGGTSLLPVAAFCATKKLPWLTVPPGTRGAALPGAVPGLAEAAAAADVAVVASFGLLLPAALLSPLRLGALNVHPSLLPRFRGAAPVPHAILAGDASTGVCIIEVSPDRFDAGAVLARRELPIAPQEGCAALTARLAAAGAEELMNSLANLQQRRSMAASAAADASATAATAVAEPPPPRAPKLHPLHGLLTWRASAAGPQPTLIAPVDAGPHAAAPLSPHPDTLTVDRVCRMARAFDDTFGVHAFIAIAPSTVAVTTDAAAPQRQLPPRRLRLVAVRPAEAAEAAALPLGAEKDEPGTLRAAARPGAGGLVLLLRLVDGWLALDRLQLEARAAQSGADFARGYHVRSGVGPATHRLVNPPPLEA